MAGTFIYKVRDKQGQIVEGELDADNTTVVAAKLREMGYIPISIDQKETGGLKKEISIGGNRVKVKDLYLQPAVRDDDQLRPLTAQVIEYSGRAD